MINAEQQLFEDLHKLAVSKNLPPRVVWGASLNLLVNAIAQSTADRKIAELILDHLVADAKTMLLKVHYDPATGKRRNVAPFTQIVQAPFLPGESVIFHGQ